MEKNIVFINRTIKEIRLIGKRHRWFFLSNNKWDETENYHYAVQVAVVAIGNAPWTVEVKPSISILSNAENCSVNITFDVVCYVVQHGFHVSKARH